MATALVRLSAAISQLRALTETAAIMTALFAIVTVGGRAWVKRRGPVYGFDFERGRPLALGFAAATVILLVVLVIRNLT
jgi:hypothetical protein